MLVVWYSRIGMEKHADISEGETVVGGLKSAPSSKKTPLMIIGAGVAVLICAITAWGIISNVKDRPHSDGTHKKVVVNTNLPATQQAEQEMYNGDYEAAQATLNNALAKAITDSEKLTLYHQLATNGINMNHYADAKKYALKSEALSPTSSTAQLLGLVAEKDHQETEAKKYYELALKRLDKTDQYYELRADDLHKAIKRVST